MTVLRSRARIWRACAVGILAVLHAPALSAQSAAAREGSVPTRGSTVQPWVPFAWYDLAERRFAESEGLDSRDVFAIRVVADTALWLMSEQGPFRFDGRRFRLLSAWPSDERPHVRDLAVTSDGVHWFATRHGIVRWRPGDEPRRFDSEDGLENGTIYRVLPTSAYDGSPQLLAAGTEHIYRWTGNRFEQLPLPASLPRSGLVLFERVLANGSTELWLTASGGAVARWQDREWRVYGRAEGLSARSVDHLAVDGVDPARIVYVASDDGVYRFDETRDRWQRLAGSPPLAYRLTFAPGPSGTNELWVGTLDGWLLRQRGTVWDTVQLRSITPRAPVTALTTVIGHGGRAAVYVGTQGDGLVRVAVGQFATVVSSAVPVRVRARQVVPSPDGNGVWLATHNFGVAQIAGNRLRVIASRADLPGGRAGHVIELRRRGGGQEIWIGGASGPMRFEQGRFVLRDEGLPTAETTTLASGPGADGLEVLRVGSGDGLFEWDGTRWVRLSAQLPSPVGRLQAPLEGDDRWAAFTADGVYWWRNGEWLAEPLPGAESGDRAIRVSSVCRHRDASGADWLVVAGADGAFAAPWADREADPVWEVVGQPSALDAARRNILVLRCDRPGSLVFGGASGLQRVASEGASPKTWSFVRRVEEGDGLPAPAVLTLGPWVDEHRLWVGTSLGAGVADLTPRLSRIPQRLRVTLRDVADAVVSGREVIPHDEPALRIAATLSTFHREDETRFRFELDGPVRTTSQWQSSPDFALVRPPAGDYEVRVFAQDYAGQIVGPQMLRFRVAYPPWRSPLAVAFYAFVATALAFGAGLAWRRGRDRRMRARTAAAEAEARATRQREREFRALFDQGFDAHLLVADGRVRGANDAAATLFARDVDALVGTPVDTLVPGLDLVALADRSRVRESVVAADDGTRHPVAVTVTRLPAERGDVVHVIVRDLTEERAAAEHAAQLESQIRDAQKLESLGTLAGGVAHDFNNLLGIIRGNTELAREEAARDVDATNGHLDAILDASDRARDLVRQILTFSRRAEARRAEVDLAALVERMRPMLRALVPKSIALEIVGTETPAPVHGDASQLEQLVLNLVSNAEYAMRGRSNGHLLIGLTTQVATSGLLSGRPIVRLLVRDSGVGMPPEIVSRVFEPFFTTKPTGEGTGLGLAVLHGIVTAHGGEVQVESRPGEGTTVAIRLPLRAGAETAVAAGDGPAPAAEAAARPLHIVVVDDEPAVARVMSEALSRRGHRVTTFTDPRDAEAHLTDPRHAVDVLVSDQTMPGLTGDMLIESVRRVRPGLPVVLVSGFVSRLAPERVGALGGVTLLPKPTSLRDLLTAVTAAGDGTLRVSGEHAVTAPER